MIIVNENFTDLKQIKKNWHWSYPWGVPSHLNGKFSQYENMYIDDGIVMQADFDKTWRMPRLFWKGSPMGYGRYEAVMTVPPMRATNVFVLYAQARYRGRWGVRSILPEIDVAEYALKDNPSALNVAVHDWTNPPAFLDDERYYDDRRHELDYEKHRQKNKQLTWSGRKIKHSCIIEPRKIQIFIDDKRVLKKCGRFPDFFNPTFGQSIPKWQKYPFTKPMIVHSFSYEV